MNYDNVTFLLSNVRSRTAWLHYALSHENMAVTGNHDPLRFCSSIEGDFKHYVDGLVQDTEQDYEPDHVFIADSGAILFSERIEQTFPGAQFLFVYRDPVAVRKSLIEMGLTPLFEPVRVAHKLHTEHWRMRNKSAWIDVDGLSNQIEFNRVLDFICPGCEVDLHTHRQLCQRNVQIDLKTHNDLVHPGKRAALLATASLK